MPLTSPSTSLSLIHRVREHDPTAWERLVGIYGPLVYLWCRRRGIKSHDAADIMQNVFSAVSTSVERFERDQGRQSFRGWLYGVTKFKIMDHYRAENKQPKAIAGELLEETIVGDPASDPYLSDPTTARGDLTVVVRRTLEAIRQEYTDVTWNAFWRTAIDNLPASEVAKELGLQAANVRQIKFRILKRVRTELAELESEL